MAEPTRRLSDDDNSVASFYHHNLSRLSVDEETIFLDELSRIIAKNKLVYEQDLKKLGKSFDAHVAILEDKVHFFESQIKATEHENAKLRATIPMGEEPSSTETSNSKRMSTISERAEARGLDLLNSNLIRGVRKDVWIGEVRRMMKRRQAVDLHNEDSTVCEIFEVVVDLQANQKNYHRLSKNFSASGCSDIVAKRKFASCWRWFRSSKKL
jgi:hypothetical protein